MMQLALLQEEMPERRVTTAELAEHLGIPAAVLSKVLLQLADADLIDSQKGPTGGVRLGRPAFRIQILDIIHVLEGPKALKKCIMGFESCSSDRPCPMHATWKQIRSDLLSGLSEISLQDWSNERNASILSLLTHAQSGAGI